MGVGYYGEKIVNHSIWHM